MSPHLLLHILLDLHLFFLFYLFIFFVSFSSFNVFCFRSSALSNLPSLRTLLLHNNQLSLLSGDLLSSLHSLEEVSLHSNPLRCDCLSSWGPHLGNQSHLKLLDSSITICSSPPHLIGQELREVVAVGWGGGGTNSCLPHITPHAFPPTINVSAGQPITLECWADADPAPQFYWVTPNGDKVGRNFCVCPSPREKHKALSIFTSLISVNQLSQQTVIVTRYFLFMLDVVNKLPSVSFPLHLHCSVCSTV